MADEAYQPFPDIAAWTAVPFDPTTYEQYAALLEQARAEASEEAREHAVKTAMRYAGTDTGAIEGLYTTDRGFTRTVAIEAAGWEAAANERGPNAAKIIKDQIAAYEWVLDLVTQERPVTEHVIRELHAMLCRSQETYVVHTPAGTQERPLPKGAYKEFPNNPTSLATGQIHHYAPPDMVGPEMARLVAAMGSPEYAAAHPVVQASFVHYSLAAIHPFADGNGRVSRALASVPLYRASRVPFMVLADQRDEYLDALASADAGDVGIFVQFVADRTVDTTDLARLTVIAGRTANRQRSIAALREIFLTSGFSRDELEAVGQRALDMAEESVRAELASVPWPQGVTWGVDREPASPEVWEVVTQTDVPYRPILLRGGIVMSVGWTEPHAGGVIWFMTAGVAINDDVPPVALFGSGSGQVLELSVSDIKNGLRAVAQIKIDTWSRSSINDFLAFAAAKASEGGKRI